MEAELEFSAPESSSPCDLARRSILKPQKVYKALLRSWVWFWAGMELTSNHRAAVSIQLTLQQPRIDFDGNIF